VTCGQKLWNSEDEKEDLIFLTPVRCVENSLGPCRARGTTPV
jgi:hypothetical protein